MKRGNPFFLEETLRTLVETGVLGGRARGVPADGPVEALQIPATVQTILAARVDRLPPEEKQLLQMAPAIGKDIPYAILKSYRGATGGDFAAGTRAPAESGVPLRDASVSGAEAHLQACADPRGDVREPAAGAAPPAPRPDRGRDRAPVPGAAE